jgi:hypothetical protein
VNVICCGDFVQYKPVLDQPLYADLLSPTDNILSLLEEDVQRIARPLTERKIQNKVGRGLWLQFNKVIFLRQQMRNKDVVYNDMMDRLRVGEHTLADYDLISTRVVRSDACVTSLAEAPWNTATILVYRNEVRTAINNLCVFDGTLQSGSLPVVVKNIDIFVLSDFL